MDRAREQVVLTESQVTKTSVGRVRQAKRVEVLRLRLMWKKRRDLQRVVVKDVMACTNRGADPL